ncbi:MAG: hypothetical protein CVU43_06010 [Chloroflexi bacterium HGW-Chloroflexi-5]|nr:MAG: hypothetical protein CVU43_06010 [Chloroflexi bacterium HGW-Chloroflexi-5]
MKALHWLRSKQEENELGYWLSFAAYDQRDRSIINKAYFLYLVIFLLIWLMMVLFFFAKYGGMALALISPDQAANTTMLLEWAVLVCWNLVRLFQASRRSPIFFSETDKALVCQTPVSRRALVIRWLWMPWFKSALPFWLLAIVLGFSTAELYYSGADTANAFFNYVSFGLRTLLQIIPIHLAFYAFQWSVGVLRLRKNDQKNWIMFPAVALGLIPLGILITNNTLYSLFDNTPLNLFMNPDYIIGSASSSMPLSISSTLLMLVLLFIVSPHFNLKRAAQETSELEFLTTASKYGFTDLVEQRRLQNRLSSKRKFTLPAKHKGSAALSWKNRIQVLRGWNWKQLFPLLTVFSISLGLPLVPGLVSKSLALFFLVLKIGPILTQRLRSDLACWPILQQLPLRKQQILVQDLISSLPMLLAAGLLGLGFSAILSITVAINYLFIMPGLLATIACTAAIDVLRKSKRDLLINGNVPSVGTQGVILGVIGTVIPVWLASIFTGLVGILFSTLSSLVITWICYKFAVYSFKNIRS